MKNLILTTGLLLLLLVGAHCYGYNDDIFNGYNRISTYSTPDFSNACMLTLAVNTTDSAMYFNQTQQLQNNCVDSNITFNSFFKDDVLTNDTLVFNPVGKVPTVIDPITAALTTADLQQQNGTGCVYLPQNFRPGYDKYFCSLHFSMINIYLETYGSGNFTFAPVFNYDYDIDPNFANRHLIDSAYNHVDVNNTFPNITAWLQESCTQPQGSSIQNLSSTVYIQANADLRVLSPNFTLAYSLVKRRGATAPGDYLVMASPSNNTLFDNGTGPCWALPITFQDMVTDSHYCSGNGCQVSLIVDNYQPSIYGTGDVYVIQTDGIITIDTTGNSSSGNGTGSGDGGNTGTGSGSNGNGSNSTGTGSNSGTGGMNGGGSPTTPPVSSALATAFNMCLILVSIVYLAL